MQNFLLNCTTLVALLIYDKKFCFSNQIQKPSLTSNVKSRAGKLVSDYYPKIEIPKSHIPKVKISMFDFPNAILHEILKNLRLLIVVAQEIPKSLKTGQNYSKFFENFKFRCIQYGGWVMEWVAGIIESI